MKFSVVMLITFGCMFFAQSSVYALECEVEYRAERPVSKPLWLISVDSIELSSDTARGSGDTLEKCKQDAIDGITKKGWKVTYTGEPKEIKN